MNNNSISRANEIMQTRETLKGFVPDVMHKIILPNYKGKFSVWFERDGSIKDAEQILPNSKTRNVKRNSPSWKALEAHLSYLKR